MRRSLSVGCLVVLLTASREVPGPIAADTPELAAVRARFVALYNRGDTTGLGDLYTADAVRMPYDAPAVAGRSGIVAAFAKGFAARQLVPTLALTAEEVAVLDSQAMERGTYHEILRSRAGVGVVTEDGKYVALLQRGRDGAWRYKWSIFNRDRAPQR